MTESPRSRDLFARATAAGAVIATAESCTAGLLAAAITDPPGASGIFDRGFVTYSNTAKTEMLGVSEAALTDHGAVSEIVAREMAEGALARSAATHAISVTGIAGPGGSESKPEGRVCFALATRSVVETRTVEFGASGRDQVRRATVDHAIEMLITALA